MLEKLASDSLQVQSLASDPHLADLTLLCLCLPLPTEVSQHIFPLARAGRRKHYM